MITSKAVAAAPQYTVVIKDWKTGTQPSAGAFVFVPPAGAQRLDVKALSRFDEIPPETANGGQK